MRDPMHQMDKGVIVQLLKAILHLYYEQVESVMGEAGQLPKVDDATFSGPGVQNRLC